jgi:(p)ppGpp synthase/HD superfamily hydrolase
MKASDSIRDRATAAELLTAALFAARKHKGQRRKDPAATPYINHPLAVAELLARVGGVSDVVVLQAALLHDTIEDTATTGDELESLFGIEVRKLVEEVTDDKSLPDTERKRLQVVHADALSPGAQLIKLADKICNVTDVMLDSPTQWSVQRKIDYLTWTEQVVANLSSPNPSLQTQFNEILREKRRLFDQPRSD